jgi:hypothetical protein
MADTESIRQAAQARVPFSAWFGMVLLFSIFGVLVLAVVGPTRRSTDFEKARVEKRLTALKAVHDEQKTLTTYAWIDKSKGTVRIPINRAMELTMVDLSNRKPSPAYPIAASSPATTAVAAPPVPSPAPSKGAQPEPNGSPRAKGKETNQSEVGNQPAAVVNPSPAPPGTQPGASATPAASPGAQSANPPVSPTQTPTLKPPGTSLPIRGKGPPPGNAPSPSPS